MADGATLSWAVVPAAGLGSRMSGLHASGCKELIEVAGCSMLERTIRELEQAGIENIVVVSSPAKPAIDAALEGRGVHIVHQSEPTGLVDAVACARPLIGDGPMLIALPDGLFPDLNPSAALLRTWQGMTTLVTVRTESPWGELLHDTGRVTSMEENRILDLADKRKDQPFPLGEHRITGRYIWTTDFWEFAEKGEVGALRVLASQGILRACPVNTAYVDVGNPEGYAYAQSILNR